MSVSTVVPFESFVISTNEDTVKASPLSASSSLACTPRNSFTVSYANRAPCNGPRFLTPARDDMAFQAHQLQVHRSELHAAFMAKHENAIASISEAERSTGVKMLLRTAAERDVDIAKKQQYPQPVLQFMKTTWQAFLQQADAFLSQPALPLGDAEVDVGQAVDVAGLSRSAAAIENVSSIGVWFSGPNVSLPLRQYAVQVPNPTSEDGEEAQTIIVVGLISFSYSSYIMQLRSVAQQSVLAELAMIEEQLGTRCLFTPKLLITP